MAKDEKKEVKKEQAETKPLIHGSPRVKPPKNV